MEPRGITQLRGAGSLFRPWSPVRAAAEAAEEAEAEGVEPGEIPVLSLEPSVAEAFEEGLRRLEHRDTWKLWRWPASDAVFYTPDEYKCALAWPGALVGNKPCDA